MIYKKNDLLRDFQKGIIHIASFWNSWQEDRTVLWSFKLSEIDENGKPIWTEQCESETQAHNIALTSVPVMEMIEYRLDPDVVAFRIDTSWEVMTIGPLLKDNNERYHNQQFEGWSNSARSSKFYTNE